MTIVEFLSYLRGLDVRLWVDGDRLRCSAPDGVLTPGLRAEMAERKAEIVAFLSGARDAVLSVSTLIRPVSREGNVPLSFAQQRMWFLDQLEPGSSFYNIPNAVRLRGSLSVAALEQSLSQIVRRHEALRTTFATVDGQAVQVIAPALTAPLPVVDLQAFSEPKREAEARRLITGEARQPFDLSRGPLIRATTLRLGEREHVLLLTTHHIISDGWSGFVLIGELAALYRAYAAGKPSPLPKLLIQYADFAVWQRQWLQEGGLEEQLAYWKQRLDGASTVLELPTDRPRRSVQTFRGASYSFVLSPSLSEALKVQSQREGVTLFATLLAAFNVLLYRYTGQEDVSVGTFVANRNRSQIEGLIGVFINVLVLRTDLSGNPTFSELLKRVYGATLEAFAHQDVPFDKLVEELQPGSDRGRIQPFRTMLVLQPPLPAIELSDLAVEWLRPEREVQPTSDLDLFFEETDEGLLGIAEYNADLFDGATIARMAGHLLTLLAAIAADSEQRISRAPFLTEAERQQLLVEWNSTEKEDTPARCVHELFEAQVDRTPDAVAVVLGEERLTYQELDRRANQLAHYLQTFGVGPDVLVGICAVRSTEMVTGLLGVLKAGGAYAPLDPTYPQGRLAFMLEDAGVSVLLTQRRLVDRLPDYGGAVVYLDGDWTTIAQEGQESPISGVTPDNLVYVIYTSGSTGRPKGAGVYQRGFVNLLNWFVTEFGLTFADSAFVISSLSFDLTQKNFYAPLMVGGTLHLLPSEYYDPQQIFEAVCDEKVTWLNCTPSASYPLAAHGDEGALAKLGSLRYLFLGGEPIAVSRLWRWLESVCCGVKVVNTYGPTECADVCAAYRLDHPERFLERTAPVGQPIFNARLFVVDQNLEPLPVGVVGELCVAGEGVGSGYVNDLELTPERFVPNPFGKKLGERLYKTGDLARHLPDGCIEFLGRMDHQVKVRGFRIELGEVETVLRQHPAVQEAVLMVREDEPGEKRLVAYVLPEHESTLTAGELREFLRRHLPDYMTPSAFVLLEALPLTPSGKVDRRALPPPDGSQPERVEEFVAPEGPVEERLAEIWAEVLRVDRVGVYDTFFDLGGYSLLVTQVISRINEAFEINLSIRSLFEEPTIANLALLIEETLLEEFE